MRVGDVAWAVSIGREVSGKYPTVLVGNSSWPSAPEEAELELELDWCCNRSVGLLGDLRFL